MIATVNVTYLIKTEENSFWDWPLEVPVKPRNLFILNHRWLIGNQFLSWCEPGVCCTSEVGMREGVHVLPAFLCCCPGHHLPVTFTWGWFHRPFAPRRWGLQKVARERREEGTGLAKPEQLLSRALCEAHEGRGPRWGLLSVCSLMGSCFWFDKDRSKWQCILLFMTGLFFFLPKFGRKPECMVSRPDKVCGLHGAHFPL